MTEDQWSANVAVGLMRMALELLDKAGGGAGTARLQHAIDTVLAERRLEPGDELAPELACLVAGIPFSRDKKT